MKKYVIEREIPGVGRMQREALEAVAASSNEVLARLAPRVKWLESFVTEDKTFCVYLAEDEEVIREHARLSHIPATRITQVSGTIDPATGLS